MKYYIAYGSNLHVPQMLQRCPDAVVVGTGILDGWALRCKGSWHRAYLTIEPEQGSTVPVAVWGVSPADEVQLDLYEGYPTLYYKRNLQVECRNRETGRVQTVDAFVYIMHEAYPITVPTDDYLQTCLEGYAAFSFPAEILQTAYRQAIETCEALLG